MAYPVRGVYSTYVQSGFENEKRVIEFMRSRYYKIDKATVYEDRALDIDIWVYRKEERVPVSLKAQHAGLRFGNVYFELATQIPNPNSWQDADLALAQKLTGRSLEGYYPSWFFTGKAQLYGITQGQDLLFYDKESVRSHLEIKGCARCRGLTKAVLATQSGKDTICAFVERVALPLKSKLILPAEKPRLKLA
jgi:hypothetical protein